MAKLARKIPVALDLHRVARRAKDGTPESKQFFGPARLGPIDGHRHDEIDRSLFQQRQQATGPGRSGKPGPTSDGG